MTSLENSFGVSICDDGVPDGPASRTDLGAVSLLAFAATSAGIEGDSGNISAC